MRVVSGKYKGRILLSPINQARPTLDKVKQAIFTKLQFDINGKNVLDLFAGSGGLGIEAISRGAEKVVFVDKDYKSIDIIKKNLKLIGENAVVLKCDYKSALEKFNEQFDIIFIDPPYASGYYETALEKIHEKNLLTSDGIIVLEIGENYNVNQSLYEEFDEKNYGTVVVKYLRNKTKVD